MSKSCCYCFVNDNNAYYNGLPICYKCYMKKLEEKSK